MNVIQSTSANQALSTTQGIGQANQQKAINKPAVTRVEESNQKPQSNSNQGQPRLEVNEKAIALIESQSSTPQKNQNTQYDKPSNQNLSAVAAYESVDNIAQRENVKQFFGVNLFA